MAEPTIITWSPANWLTVVIMVAIAFFIAGAIAKTIKQKQTATA
jgi:hypothetical protein